METSFDIAEKTIIKLTAELKEAHELTRKALEQRDELADALGALVGFTFVDRWPTKGLDEDALAVYQRACSALSKLEKK